MRLKLGTLKASKLYEFKVTTKNDSSEAFSPKDVFSSCSCAAAAITRSSVAPGSAMDLAIRIAVPNSPGDFRRQVTVNSKGADRIDFLLEGQVQMPFESSSEEFVVDENGRSVVLDLTSNEGLLKDDVRVTAATAGLRVDSIVVKGKTCQIRLGVSDSWASSLATVVVTGETKDGKNLEQRFALSIRNRELLQLKPRVMRFVKKEGRWECRFFVYGEKDELKRLDLKNVVVAVSSDAAALESATPGDIVRPLRVVGLQQMEHGVAGTFVCDSRFTDKAKCYLRLALKPGEFLDQRYVLLHE